MYLCLLQVFNLRLLTINEVSEISYRFLEVELVVKYGNSLQSVCRMNRRISREQGGVQRRYSSANTRKYTFYYSTEHQ